MYGDARNATEERNSVMRRWAEARAGGNVRLLDFHGIAAAENAPPGVASGNWHYSCFLDANHHEAAQSALGNLSFEAAWAWPNEQRTRYPSIWADDAAQCSDEMNRILLQVLLNMLLRGGTRVPSTNGAS